MLAHLCLLVPLSSSRLTSVCEPTRESRESLPSYSVFRCASYCKEKPTNVPSGPRLPLARRRNGRSLLPPTSTSSRPYRTPLPSSGAHNSRLSTILLGAPRPIITMDKAMLPLTIIVAKLAVPYSLQSRVARSG